MSPFIQPRLSSKTVESIWAEAVDSVVCNQSGCHNKATKVWDTPVKGSQVGYCDEHEGPATKAQPKTAGAKVVKSPGGKSWQVKCDACGNTPMHNLTHDGASQLADSHNRAHHSKTSADVNYGGGPGSDDPGINLNYVDMGHEPKSDRLGTDATCDICGKAILFDGFHGPMERDEYGHSSPSKSWKHVVRASAHEAFTHDEIDWTDIEPGSPECASYRPSDREETMRIVRKEDDRRKNPRDTPDRREVSKNAGFHPGQEYGFGKFDDDILADYTESPDCLECGKPIASSSVAKGWGDLQFCDKSCENKWSARPSSEKFASRRTARFTWDGPAGF